MDFPQALRRHRAHRRLSQLDLAVRVGTTQRHVSFMETGRSAPGRTMVVRLAESLELPLRERNDLLLTAGYAPVYPRTPLDDDRLAPVREALEHILTGHLPYPAVVVDRYGDLVSANRAFHLLVADADPELLRAPANLYRLALHPRGLAPRILNFAEWARHVLDGLHRAVLRNPRRLTQLRAELDAYVPHETPGSEHLGFAVPLRLRPPRDAEDTAELRLMTTVSTFATAVEVSVSELKLEAFLPVDQ
ncbi:XRE family transcriptional regulator [Streptomyces albus subsp. albus]|nr:XRE family transcriptional regulator [Streptomyces albus subsp. albus]